MRSPFYDLLILIIKKQNKAQDKTQDNTFIFKYKAFLIHIDINKTKEKIDKIQNDFKENKNNYMKSIKKFIDNNKINIRDIELLFIFDKSHQQQLQMKDEIFTLYGSKYCLDNKINFYLYSTVDNCLYYTSDLICYKIVNNFGEDKSKKNFPYLLEKDFIF